MSSLIKVLCVSTNGIKVDGITSWMIATFGAMSLDGIHVTTTAFEGCPDEVRDAVQNVGIEVLTVPNRKQHPCDYMRSFRQLIQRGNYDIIHVCCNSAMATFELLEAKKARVRMRIAHSHNTVCSHPIANYLLNPLFQSLITDRYACGRDAGKWLFGKRTFTIIPNGKEMSKYSFSRDMRLRVREALGIGADNVVLGHVGSFNTQKNHAKLIDIFACVLARVPNALLVLIGEGPLMSSVKAQVEGIGITEHVRFLGSREDVPDLLNAMDCMVFPSLYEGFPNVVLEWQLNGLPVVMSSTITDECKITPLVSQLPLEADADLWSNAIESAMLFRDRVSDSSDAIIAAKNAGYDIYDNAAMLHSLYLGGVARSVSEK